MKKVFLFLILFSFCSALSAQTLSSQEKEIVQKLIQDAFDEIWSNLDTTKILQYHTDDFVLLEHGEIWDNETIKII